MKQYWACFILVFALIGVPSAQAQARQDKKPLYEQNPMLPDFALRMLDSVTVLHTRQLSKGKPIVFILFSPDCDHCAQLAQQINDSADALKGLQLIMVAPPVPLHDIKMFAYTNGLTQRDGVIVAQDIEFFFGSFYKATTVPFIVVYDQKKKLVSSLTRMKHISELIQVIRAIPSK
jgi:protein-disulfide isomerase